MATRTFTFPVFDSDGLLYTEATAPTVTVQYGAGAASTATVVKRGNAWSVEIDDTQDATILVSGSGITPDGFIAFRYPAQLDASVSSRLASADYTAPANATIAAIDGKVDALNDLSLGDVGTALTTYGVAKDTDIPTDYSTFDATTETVTLADKTGFSLVADYDPAKTAASPAEVATALTTYGPAKPSDIPTDYALESTLQATQSAVEALNDFNPATDTVATVQTVVEPVTALVDVSGIPDAVWAHSTRTLTSATGGGATAEEVWAYAERTLTDDIPTETADLLGTRHGVGLWGAADPSWPAITSATLDDDGNVLGPLDSADVLIVAQADGSSYGTRSDGDGEFELRVPSGATYTLQALRPGFAYPIRTVTI